MDKAKIEAMRKVIEMHERSVAYYDGYGDTVINMKFGSLPVETLRVATEGFRTLVDKAAAEHAEPVAASGDEETTAASEDGPTIEEHTEALNRSEYLGASDWTVVVTSQGADHTIDADVCSRVGEWLIAREKAAEGGAL